MYTNMLAVTAALVATVGSPANGIAEDKGTAATSKNAELRVPFLHGLSSKPPIQAAEVASLEQADAWLNSPPLIAPTLRGKVVLIDFWTYTCINWLRTAPYIRAWAEKYKDQGLVVIGVHSPEFAFEKNIENVRWAVKERRITYPVAVDNEHNIWRAFKNNYWPALYFMDAQGRVRHSHFGEGSYEQSEMVIQTLLAETGRSPDNHRPVSVDAIGIEAPADWGNLRSAENYVGHERAENFRSPGGMIQDQPHVYQFPAKLSLNEWALSGFWTVNMGRAVSNADGGRITYRFHARDLHLVMGPMSPENRIRFRVKVDGKPPTTSRGADVDEDGFGVVTQQRLYQLIRQPGPVTDRQFEIEFLDPGVETFAFTFG